MFRSFSKLQWKLTLSYTLVTVGALVLLQLLIVLFAALFLYRLPQMTNLMRDALEMVAKDIAPALAQTPPDQPFINEWLAQTNGGRRLKPQTGNLSFDFNFTDDTAILLMVIDQNDRIVGSTLPETVKTGDVYWQHLNEQEIDLVRSTKRGTSATDRSTDSARIEWMMAAAPIFYGEERIGALFYRLELPAQQDVVALALASLLPSSLIFTIAAGLMGTIFGAVTARGLTKRLKKVAKTASAWGGGDFQPRIQDHSADEIGMMANDLNQMAEELQSLVETRQELATLEERNRLARDLHDSVKQQVFAISMNLGAIQSLWDRNPEEARRRLESTLALSRQTQQELTGLIQTLRPIQISEKGLVPAIKEFVQAWEKQSHIATIFQAQDIKGLSEQVEQTLYRVTQEALSNIIRHSGATAAGVSIHAANHIVSLQITDNGHGFDQHTVQKGLGLHSMQERVQNVGGKFHLQSSSTGTVITIQVPIQEEA